MILASLILAASMASESSGLPPLVPFWDPPDAGPAREVPTQLSMDGCQTDCEAIANVVREYLPKVRIMDSATTPPAPGSTNEMVIGFARPNTTDGGVDWNDHRRVITQMSFGSQLFVTSSYGFLPVGVSEVEAEGLNCYLALWHWTRAFHIERDKNAVLVFGNIGSEDARRCLEQTLTMMGRKY